MMIIFLYSTLCYPDNVIIEATMLIALLTIIPSSTRASRARWVCRFAPQESEVHEIDEGTV